MALENWQKVKIFRLAELLKQESDEEHPMKTAQVCSRLEEMGIPCDRRTLAEDIEILNKQGMEIKWKWVGKSKAFYVEDRSFSESELKILIDAVQAASFIPEGHTIELIEKIADLGGTHKAKILKDNVIRFNTRKHSDEDVFDTVDALEKALHKRKKIIFRYFDLGVDGEKVYRRDGHHYIVEPVGLVFSEDNYYMVACSEHDDDTADYRIDRMEDVELTDEKLSDKAIKLRTKVRRNGGQAIKMYGGELRAVELEFDKSLMGVVYDRFGEKTKMIAADGDKIRTKVKVQISPTFWGWLFQFGDKMKVLGPEEVKEEYRERAAGLLKTGDTVR